MCYKSKIGIFLLAGSFCLADASYYKVINISIDDILMVHKDASASSPTIAKLMPYDTGLTLGACGMNGRTKWCKVSFLVDDCMMFERGLTNEGWVNRKYLTKADNIIYSNAISYGKQSNIFAVVNVARHDTLNVREHPYSDAKKVGVLYADDRGIIAQKCQRVGRSRWCYVAYDYTMGWAMGPGSSKVPYAKTGWVNMRYLRADTSGKKGRLPQGLMFNGEVY